MEPIVALKLWTTCFDPFIELGRHVVGDEEGGEVTRALCTFEESDDSRQKANFGADEEKRINVIERDDGITKERKCKIRISD
jgi:hypothetical protein